MGYLRVCQPYANPYKSLTQFLAGLMGGTRSIIMLNAIAVSFNNQTITAFLHNETHVVLPVHVSQNP